MEYCKIGLDICDKSGKIVRKLKGNIPNDHYNLFELSVEIIRNADHSVLIFCSTKNDTQDIAFQLSKIMGKQIKNYRVSILFFFIFFKNKIIICSLK